MTEVLKVGTRRSPLARVQTEIVVQALVQRRPGLRLEARALRTSGDRDRRPGGSPDFTDAIDRALLEGEIDLAVHSAKDLPLALAPGLALSACPRRVDPRDCLVLHRTTDAANLPRGARVGSSSARRRAQLLRWRPDLKVIEMRGNVDHRLERVRDGEFDAAILAVAGLQRLGRAGEIGRILPVREFLPAPAQGALAVVVRATDRSTEELVSAIDHSPTHAAVVAERSFASALGGDCATPLGALARTERTRLSLDGEVLAPNGRVRIRGRASGPSRRPAELGSRLARTVLDRGAGILLSRTRG